MPRQARQDASASYSNASIAIAAYGITLTASLPPLGAVFLGTVLIAGALYTAYRLARPEPRSEPLMERRRSGLHILAEKKTTRREADYVQGIDLLGADWSTAGE